MYGSMDETVGRLMCEFVKLNEFRDEMYGKFDFDEKWLVNVTRNGCLKIIKNFGRFLRLALEQRSIFL